MDTPKQADGQTPKPVNVLISLFRGYGMGDGVQMSSVLRHVKKYRTNWIVDYQAEPGKEVVARGLVKNIFAYGDPYPTPHYDAEVQICLYDTWANWGDRPNTRVSSCLHDVFGLGWDEECGRYQIEVRDNTTSCVKVMLTHVLGTTRLDGVVAVHYQGDSSQERKNLTDAQALEICKFIRSCGKTSMLIDWRDKSSISRPNKIPTTGTQVSFRHFGGDAELNCAVISQCEAFIGIDSGPAKCASATNTPALVVWTGHHPAPFHDPAPNTTHLVPVNYHGLKPVCDDAGVIKWFESHYNIRHYAVADRNNQNNLVEEVKSWLKNTLK